MSFQIFECTPVTLTMSHTNTVQVINELIHVIDDLNDSTHDIMERIADANRVVNVVRLRLNDMFRFIHVPDRVVHEMKDVVAA